MNQIKKYPDGASYADIDLSQDEFTYRVNTYEDLIHLIQIVEAFNSVDIVPLVSIPCLIDSQADRRFGVGTSSGLRIVCKLLQTVKAHWTVFHPHNPEVLEALLDGISILGNHELVIDTLEKLNAGPEDTILMSSDAGGFKPLLKTVEYIKWQGEVYSASKARSGNQLTQIVDRQDFQGKNILIVDDLCVFGGTFIGLAEILKSRNIGNLYLLVSHMTVPNPNPRLAEVFTRIFTTNSKGLTYQLPEEKLEVFEISSYL
jgi:ribose-phosphate pyrophosphokinase